MKVTSAYANKILKQLSDEKAFWVNKEEKTCVYVATSGETPVIPDYDYKEVAGKIGEIDEKIGKIKHAINLANINGVVSVNETEMTIDQILVAMAQKNKRKSQLDFMRKQQPKMRVEDNYYRSGSRDPEYQYINYDLDLIKSEYELVAREIMDMQIALDRYNQTVEFEIDI